MSEIFSALTVAYVAACLWLAVRITNRRERCAKQAALGMVLALVMYQLSLGPTHCVAWCLHSKSFWRAANVVYGPVVAVCEKSNTTRKALHWYTTHWQFQRVDGIEMLPPGSRAAALPTFPQLGTPNRHADV